MTTVSRQSENLIHLIHDIRPLVLEVSGGLLQKLNEHAFPERVAHLRRKVALSLGIVFPGVSVRENPSLGPARYCIKVREVVAAKGSVQSHFFFRQSLTEIERQISRVVHRHGYEFLGNEEVEELLDHFRSLNPDLLKGVYPALLSVSDIRQILRNLLQEGIPIRDLPKIFESLETNARFTQDPDILTEYVRHGLSRVLGSLYQDKLVIHAYKFDKCLEQVITGSIRWNEGAFLDLPPEISAKLEKILAKKFRPFVPWKEKNTVLLVSPGIRRFVKTLTEWSAPGTPVVSTTEIPSDCRVKIAGEITLDKPESFKLFVRGKPRKFFPGDALEKALVVLNALGPVLAPVGELLDSGQREALLGRAVIAPLPTQGKEEVFEEFFSYLPPEKTAQSIEAVCELAGEDPSLIASVLEKHWLGSFTNLPRHKYFTSVLRSRTKRGERRDYLGGSDLGKILHGIHELPSIVDPATNKSLEDAGQTFSDSDGSWCNQEVLDFLLKPLAKAPLELHDAGETQEFFNRSMETLIQFAMRGGGLSPTEKNLLEPEKFREIVSAEEVAPKKAEVARKQAQEEAQRIHEDILKKAEAEAEQIRNEALKQAEEQAQRVREEALKQAQEEAQRIQEDILKQAEVEAERIREEARRKAEEAARQAEDETLKKAEEARKAEEEAQRIWKAALKKADEEARRVREMALKRVEKARKAKEARQKATEEARRVQEKARKKAEEARKAEKAQLRAEEEARRLQEKARRKVEKARKAEEAARRAQEKVLKKPGLAAQPDRVAHDVVTSLDERRRAAGGSLGLL